MSEEPKNAVREAILELTAARGVGGTIAPEDAAKAVSADRWQKLLPDVRAEAVRLAKDGVIAIYRKGKPADPETFKGVYRIGLPGKVIGAPSGG